MGNAPELTAVFSDIIKENITPDAWSWLYAQSNPTNSFNINSAFGIMPRKTGKAPIQITSEQQDLINTVKPGLTINNWAVDRLSRVWVLAQCREEDEDKYFRAIENLFSAAEMN